MFWNGIYAEKLRKLYRGCEATPETRPNCDDGLSVEARRAETLRPESREAEARFAIATI